MSFRLRRAIVIIQIPKTSAQELIEQASQSFVMYLLIDQQFVSNRRIGTGMLGLGKEIVDFGMTDSVAGYLDRLSTTLIGEKYEPISCLLRHSASPTSGMRAET